jgi:endonuclease/exonuclease/phosphatase family metal-dependent hydrolase
MRPARPALRLLTAITALGVGLALTLAPTTTASAHPRGHDVTLSVETYNMDGGGDLTPLFAGGDLVTATSTVWASIAQSNIPGRAVGVARDIARMQPDVVGLQEAAVWSSAPAAATSPTSVVPTGPFAVQFDSLASLLAALKSLGSPYRVVVKDKTFGNEAFPLPAMTSPTQLSLVTFTDYNVILVRERSLARGLHVRNASAHTYQAALPVSVAGMQIAVTRGWAQVDVPLQGKRVRVVDTHFEAFGTPPIKDDARNPQALELAALVSSWTRQLPVIVVGDINARPTMCTTIPRTDPFEHTLDQNVVAYGILTKAGLTEVWPALHPKAPCAPRSWTSGSRELDDPAGILTHRIDDVFFSARITPLKVRIVGTRTWEMAGGLWPSDHASTWALLRLGHVR